MKNENKVTKPEWIRLPKVGTVCPHSGLTRAHMYALAAEGKIKTVSLRERGKTRGVRLVSFDSLMQYIANVDEQGASPFTMDEKSISAWLEKKAVESGVDGISVMIVNAGSGPYCTAIVWDENGESTDTHGYTCDEAISKLKAAIDPLKATKVAELRAKAAKLLAEADELDQK